MIQINEKFVIFSYFPSFFPSMALEASFEAGLVWNVLICVAVPFRAMLSSEQYVSTVPELNQVK